MTVHAGKIAVFRFVNGNAERMDSLFFGLQNGLTAARILALSKSLSAVSKELSFKTRARPASFTSFTSGTFPARKRIPYARPARLP